MFICVVAAFLGLGFSNIDKIERFQGAGCEAVMRERIEAVVAKETEPDVQERQSGDGIESYGLVGDESPRIVKALMNSLTRGATLVALAKNLARHLRKSVRPSTG
jgi:hypothetical protein